MKNTNPCVLYYSEREGWFHIRTIDRHFKFNPKEHLRVLSFHIEDRDANEFCNQMEEMYSSLDVMKEKKNNGPFPSYDEILEHFNMFRLGISFDKNGMHIKRQ